MKLVTGIEAIQSGKPSRYWPKWAELGATEWIASDQPFPPSIRPEHLLEERWEIKQEPREFWIQPYDNHKLSVTRVRDSDNPEQFRIDGYIKVREVLDE